MADRARPTNSFRGDVLSGLRGNPKSLPCKWFYDAAGSRLFERICRTPEYYITRVELALLHAAAPAVACALGPNADILEPGSGAGDKIRVLLDALDSPARYQPFDISEAALAKSAGVLAREYPRLTVTPVCADFTLELGTHGPRAKHGRGKRLIFFPGSTIGNFDPQEGVALLDRFRALLHADDYLLAGVDLVKDSGVLERAYNDAQGVTAAFNRNILERICRELDADIEPARFSHRAFYDRTRRRVEMHLESREDHVVHIEGEAFLFRAGETIHTENCYKLTLEDVDDLAIATGFRRHLVFCDDQRLFSLHLLRAC